MEYEQVEYGRQVVEEAIQQQDINGYFDLLAPDVLLVTHFPYPSTFLDMNTKCVSTLLAPTAPPGSAARRGMERRERELLQQQERWRAAQLKRYNGQRLRGTFRRGMDHTNPTNSVEDDAAEKEEDGVTPSLSLPAETMMPAASTLAASKTAAGPTTMKKRTTASSTAAATRSVAASASSETLPSRAPLGFVSYIQQQLKILEASYRSKFPTAATTAASATAASGTTSAAAVMAAAKAAADMSASISALKKAAVVASAGAMDLLSLHIPYRNTVDIAEGRLNVMERFFQLSQWVRATGDDYVAVVDATVSLRKGVLQDDEVLPPPPVPATEQEVYEQLGRQHTDRNQPLSCLAVTWGREHLLFRDRLFFDDGAIITIHRSFVPAEEVAAGVPASERVKSSAQRVEDILREVRDFYGVSSSRVNSVNKAWGLLDYSFVPVPDPVMLLRLKPRSGTVHVSKPPRPATDPRLAQGVFLNEDNDPTKMPSESGRTLIKAKNKHGDEEAYEFEKSKSKLGTLIDNGTGGRGMGLPGDGTGAGERLSNRYDAICVRVSSCNLGPKIELLVPVLRRLVVNCFITLQSLDLSDNQITEIPDLRLLPLQKLQLHANRISSWAEVETKVAPLPYLSFVTLHGNPIADENKVYWRRLLSCLMRSTTRRVALQHVDFVMLTAQDYEMAGAFEMFASGSEGVMRKAKAMAGSTKSLLGTTSH